MKHGPISSIETVLMSELEKKQRWVAFDGFALPSVTGSMHFFDSSIQAGEFCSDNLFRRDPEDGDLTQLDYHYYSIENLLAECKQTTDALSKLLAKPEAVEALLQQEAVKSCFLDKIRDVSILLALGRLAAVSKQFVITPLELMTGFHIVEHSHQSVGLIYELGHSRRILQSYQSFSEAKAAFEAVAKTMSSEEEKATNNLILVGQFKDQLLKLDGEGYPDYNCGMAISQACILNKVPSIHQICDPALKTPIEQRLFIRLNENKDSLCYLDDRLNEVTPGSILSSYHGCNFRAALDPRRLALITDLINKVRPDKFQAEVMRLPPDKRGRNSRIH